MVAAAYQKYDCLSTDHSDIGMLARQPTNHSHSHSLPLPQSDSRTALSAHTVNTPHCPPSLLFLPNDVPREDIGIFKSIKVLQLEPINRGAQYWPAGLPVCRSCIASS